MISKEADARFFHWILGALVMATLATGGMAAIAASNTGPAILRAADIR